MTEILGKMQETWYHPCQDAQGQNHGIEAEPALARILACNAACKAEMAAELIADGFSYDQIRRLLHLADIEAPHPITYSRMEE